MRNKHNVFTEEVTKTALSASNDERIQSIDLIETYANGASKDLVYMKEKIKCNNTMKQCKIRLTLMLLQKKA